MGVGLEMAMNRHDFRLGLALETSFSKMTSNEMRCSICLTLVLAGGIAFPEFAL